MSKKFFIVGLPRSRTAWFAALTTTASSVCYHEPTPRLKSFDNLVNLWTDQQWEHVGMSDSALGFQISRILAEIEPRTLIIGRALNDVAKSFLKFMGDVELKTLEIKPRLHMLQQRLDAVATHPLVKHVAFDDLEEFDVIQDCVKWLGVKVSGDRIRDLMRLNIQLTRRAAIEDAKRPHTGWNMT